MPKSKVVRIPVELVPFVLELKKQLLKRQLKQQLEEVSKQSEQVS